MSDEEDQCASDNLAAIHTLRPDQPYSPRDCDAEREVKGLTADDFLLFQDGQPQKIEGVERASWELDVRDSRSWHHETSTEPNAVWSTTELEPLFKTAAEYSYYMIQFVPNPDNEGCHRIRVEVRNPKAAEVFARDEYCAEQTPSDLVRGTKTGQQLERELAAKRRGKIPLFLQAGTFRSGGAQPRMDVVLEFPWSQLEHQWGVTSGKLSASIGVLGTVYTNDGTLVTRFSDLLWPSYWPTILRGYAGTSGITLQLPSDDPSFDIAMAKGHLSRWDPAWLPTRYETQFDLPPGAYDLKVVLSDGRKFGRAEIPLIVENYDDHSLALGSIFLCTRFRDAHVAALETAAANFAPQYVPLVSKGVRVTPAGDTRFAPDDELSAYFEIYEPAVPVEPTPRIQAHLRIVAKDGAIVKDFPPVDAAPYAQPGSTTIPLAREIPISTLSKGEYRLEVQASDSTGRTTPWRAASFTITGKN